MKIGSSSRQGLETFIRSGYRALNRGDHEAALEWWHPEAEIDSSAAFVVHSPYRGPDGVREFYESIGKVFRDFTVEPGEMKFAGNRVLVAARTRGRAVETGERHEGMEYDLWTLRDGRACRLEIFFDREEAEAALRS